MPSGLTTSTEQPKHEGGFPPFDAKTFPSQLFWLAITFSLLFVVLWRLAGPMISSTIASRRKRINDDIATAQRARTDADTASAAYETALAGARARALALADANRKTIAMELDKTKASADQQAQSLIADAEKTIGESRARAKEHVTRAAQEAAVAIVQRLLSEQVSPEDAAAAVRATANAGRG